MFLHERTLQHKCYFSRDWIDPIQSQGWWEHARGDKVTLWFHSVTSELRQKATESFTTFGCFQLCFISTSQPPTAQTSPVLSALFSTSLSDPAWGFVAFEKEGSLLPRMNSGDDAYNWPAGCERERKFFAATNLKAFPDRLQQVGHQRVVPQVGEPHPRTFYVHWARKEEAWTCRNKPMNVSGENVPIICSWMKRSTVML